MDNNNNKDVRRKLEREIWLFEQWLNALDDLTSETQLRIKQAYEECIASRRAKLDRLDDNIPTLDLEFM